MNTTNFLKLTPNIMVDDVNRTVDYYRDILGFEHVMTVPEAGTLDWALVKRGGISLMFQSTKDFAEGYPAFADKKAGGTLSFFCEVEDIQALYDDIAYKVNVTVEMHRTFYDMDEFTIEDCNGYVLTFAESAR